MLYNSFYDDNERRELYEEDYEEINEQENEADETVIDELIISLLEKIGKDKREYRIKEDDELLEDELKKIKEPVISEFQIIMDCDNSAYIIFLKNRIIT